MSANGADFIRFIVSPCCFARTGRHPHRLGSVTAKSLRISKNESSQEACVSEEQHNRVRAIVGGAWLFPITALNVPLHQAARSVSMGSICVARQSGIAAASNTIRNAANAAEEKTTGSWVETPKTRLSSHRDAPQLPASPTTNPITPNLATCLPVRRKMALLPAPIAIRMAISCRRQLTQ